MKTCPSCQQELTGNRKVCRDCMKKESWDKLKWKEADQLLSPRIVQALFELESDIKLDKEDLRPQKGLFLHGPAGTGKTIYAAAILMELKRLSYLQNKASYIKGCFINVLDLLEELRNSFNSWNKVSTEEIINQYSQVDVLILDDLGGQKITDWVLGALMLILNRRYENLKPTIITSNGNLNHLATQYDDDRIPSRISEMCRIKQFKNHDYRVRK